jgi:mannonate dehydratase
MLAFRRCGAPLACLLEHRDLFPRIVNGSDYPVPVVSLVTSTFQLSAYGYLTTEERLALNEIFVANPLLYDFVAKRTVKWAGERFPISVFLENKKLVDYSMSCAK